MNEPREVNGHVPHVGMTYRRHKVFLVSPEDFLACLRGEKRIYNVPNGAQALCFSQGYNGRDAGLVCAHETFELVPMGQPPCVRATMEKIR